MKNMLRIITTILVLSSIIPGTSVVNASRLTNNLQDTELLKSKDLEMQSDIMIQDVEQYIEVREYGTIGFKNNIPMLIYKKYNLNDLQAHFNFFILVVKINIKPIKLIGILYNG